MMISRPSWSFVLRLLVLAFVVCPGTGMFAGTTQAEDVVSSAAAETNAIPIQATRVLTENDVVDLIVAKLQQDYIKEDGKLELQLTQPWTAPTVPDEPLTLKILELPSVGVTPMFIIRFQLCNQDKSLGTWQTSVRAHVWRQVWVAGSDLRRGALVADTDLKQERRDVLLLRDSPADISPTETGLELAQTVPAGSILLDRMLRPRTLIHRGQVANALVEAGSLNVTTKVEALQDGAAGQVIRVRNVSSRRDLTGKVMNDQTVIINL